MQIYIESETGVRFRVLEYDKESGEAALQGAFGATFRRNISKPMLQKYGFKVVKSDKELPLNDRPGLQKSGAIQN